MSPSTAPASIEASCPGSPTRISRASGRTASTSRAIMRQRHHRGLVDDHHVVRQPVAAVVAEAAVRVGPPAEQPVQRRRALEQLARCRVERRASRLVVHGLAQPRRRLAGRRGERDQRRRRRPARAAARRSARPSSSCRCPGRRRHREPAPHARSPRPQPLRSSGRRRTAARGRRSTSARRPGRGRRARAGRRRAAAPRASSGRGTARALEPQRPVARLADGDERARRSRASPRRRRPATAARSGRPARRRRPWRCRGSSRGRRRRARAAARGPRARPPSSTVSSRSPASAASRVRDVHVGGREHAGVVERAQQAGGARTRGDRRTASRHARVPVEHVAQRGRPARRGGRHANTPHGVPSTTGVSGPIIPRTNR